MIEYYYYDFFFRERADNDNCEDIDDDGVSNFCDCLHTVMNQFIILSLH